jgi:Rps23 Pro-64 3,4-dihydroxylase Tpa1-like proline 4-hydroxylase
MSQPSVEMRSLSTMTAEASAETTRFNASERSAYLRLNINQIRSLIHRGTSVEEIKQTYAEFAEQYELVFNMITRPEGYDERALQMMINMLDQMGAGKLSQHEASVNVGKVLVDKFVTPQLAPR